MPPTHVTDAEIEQFHRRQLPGDALLPLADHLANCDDCRRRVAAQGDPATASASLREDAQVSAADELRSWSSGSRRWSTAAWIRTGSGGISAHLDPCPACGEGVLVLYGRVHVTPARPGQPRITLEVDHRRPGSGGDPRAPRALRSDGCRARKARDRWRHSSTEAAW